MDLCIDENMKKREEFHSLLMDNKSNNKIGLNWSKYDSINLSR